MEVKDDEDVQEVTLSNPVISDESDTSRKEAYMSDDEDDERRGSNVGGCSTH